MVDKEKFGKIQQGYSKNQTCLEKKKIKYKYLKIKILKKIFEKVNISITKIKLAYKNFEDSYKKIKIDEKKLNEVITKIKIF